VVQELFTKVREIKGKAEQSEVMVQEICRDIKKLDYAKKHITTTITALHRLSMLGESADCLRFSIDIGNVYLSSLPNFRKSHLANGPPQSMDRTALPWTGIL
jgi:hypothetical protein